MKIRTAIFATYAIASAVGLAVLMRFVLAEVRPRYVASLRTTLQESAELLAAGLAAQPKSRWAEAFARIAEVHSGIAVQVSDPDGVLFASDPVGEVDEAYPRGVAKQWMSRAVDGGEVQMNGVLAVFAPIVVDGDPVGELRLSRPLSSVNAFIWSERKKLTLGTAVVAAVMLGLGWWLANRLAGSLQRLAAYATAVREGRSARLPTSRATEIAAVGTAFEDMRQALEGKQYVERYTQSLSHELKAPLTAIRGAAELLQEPTMNPESRTQFLGHLRTESARIQGIIDRMLELSALESRTPPTPQVNLDLREVIQSAVEAMQPVATQRRVVLVVEPPPARETWWVLGERFLLTQAVINLIQNAVEFSPPDGRVEIGVSAEKKSVRVVVNDEGPGVPLYATAKVFDRFYSLPRRVGGRKSTGLGLSFVREIMRQHHGNAGLRNRPSGGAQGWIELPCPPP